MKAGNELAKGQAQVLEVGERGSADQFCGRGREQ